MPAQFRRRDHGSWTFKRAQGATAFRWTRTTGMSDLGSLSAGVRISQANGVSGDGSVVVGTSTNAAGQFEAFRWTSDTGIVGLGDLPGGGFESHANDVSADGKTVVGTGGNSNNAFEAYRWTESTGMIGLGDLPGGVPVSHANGVSADGSVVVGSGWTAGGGQAFRWTAAEGMVGLGISEARAVSPDGQVAVGLYAPFLDSQASRWTRSTGGQLLGSFPGGGRSGWAIGASEDGSRIVGYSDSSNGFRAFIWDEQGGMRDFQNLLLANGVSNLEGWSLTVAYDITPDGMTIVGGGINPRGRSEAWIATIPEPRLGARCRGRDTGLPTGHFACADRRCRSLTTRNK